MDAAGNQGISGVVGVTVSDPDPNTGTVAGVISRTAPIPRPGGIALASTPPPASIVPGEVFVVFKPGVRDTSLGISETNMTGKVAFSADGGFVVAGHGFVEAASNPRVGSLSLYRTSGLDEAGTRDLIATLSASDTVAEAFPNWILSTAAAPNDPQYDAQWHYEQLNLPDAWDIETGTTNKITVAVLDTGRFEHPDVQWASGGANFVNWDGSQPDEAEGPIDNFYTNP